MSNLEPIRASRENEQTAQANTESFPQPPRSLIWGLALLLLGVGAGWGANWWLSSRSEQAPPAMGAMTGQPQAVPVRLAAVQRASVEDNITITFDSARDEDIAAVDVQNRVAIAQPQLPDIVQRTGVRVTKQSNSILMAFGLFSEDNRYDPIFLSNYADRYLVDALRRIDGIGDVRVFGERRYAMRLWLDPNRLASRGLTTQDVVNALNEQNIQVGAGQIGQEPAPEGQQFQTDLRAISQLADPREFENVILKTDENGALIRLKDVGRAELGAQNYNSFLRFRGQEAVGLGIYQLPNSNALDVARAAKAEMARLSETFPPGISYQLSFDTTLFVEQSLQEVVITLLMAVGLVILIIFVFLQDWRTTLIPALTIPLALIGTFAFIRVFNFSINSLTLFGLTLASGMVVDDAIVVVEQISRYIQDREMSPRRAASLAMSELFGAVIATSLVLMAVFVPVAFFPGTTGTTRTIDSRRPTTETFIHSRSANHPH